MRKIAKKDIVWRQVTHTGYACYYKDAYVARTDTTWRSSHILGDAVHVIGIDEATRVVLCRLNALTKVQRQATLLGACWPAVHALGEYVTWREAWEAWGCRSDMVWLLYRLRLKGHKSHKGLSGSLHEFPSAQSIRDQYPWPVLRAASLRLWPEGVTK